ncbi:hypothetical protein Tco_0506003 [Tanacetum coccineum]
MKNDAVHRCVGIVFHNLFGNVLAVLKNVCSSAKIIQVSFAFAKHCFQIMNPQAGVQAQVRLGIEEIKVISLAVKLDGDDYKHKKYRYNKLHGTNVLLKGELAAINRQKRHSGQLKMEAWLSNAYVILVKSWSSKNGTAADSKCEETTTRKNRATTLGRTTSKANQAQV